MALKASLGVILGCQFGPANRLLAAADKGDERVVAQVLCEKPQLAAFTGFHGTTSPLHRAAAAGHLGVCRAILEPLKQRVRAAEAAAGGKRSAAATKWQRLLSTVLNQRSHKSLTPLMLACEHGHAEVAAYLLREGADPLAADFVHSRTCLHYAAVGGHADCLRLLCSDSAQVTTSDGARPLRDVIVSDLQVQACRFVDQRAFGGLTALHFAVVTGSLDAVQALLRGGASIMVKSDGEAYIGDDFLVPGSSPLHVAVIINSISIVHAILQTHMEMMNILGTTLDERGRRPWEGTSRTDIRSVRNHFRKLPFHLARERHQPQLMSLVDPRIPIDVALDAARDTEHGIGPKRLSTICSLVLQRSLLRWLDDCQRELAKEAAGRPPRPPSSSSARRSSSHAAHSAAAAAAPPPVAAEASSPRPTAAAGAAAAVAPPQSPQQQSHPQLQMPTQSQYELVFATNMSPFSGVSSSAGPASPLAAGPPYVPGGAVSAPTTPARTPAALPPQASGATTVGAVPSLEAAAGAQGSAQHMASLHGYMGMLSKAPSSMAAMESAAGGPAGVRSLQRQLSGSVTLQQLMRSSSGINSAARVRFLTEPAAGAAAVAASAAAAADLLCAGVPPGVDPAAVPGSNPESPRLLASPRDNERRIEVVPLHRRSTSTGNLRMGLNAVSMSSIFGGRRRSESGNLPSPGGPAAGAPSPAGTGVVDAAVAAALGGEQSLVTVLAMVSDKDKDMALDSEGEPESPLSRLEEDVDVECGVCLDALVEVAFASCQHKLCLACARNLTQQNKKPPHCPFCRAMVVGFQRVSATGLISADNSGTHDGCAQQAAIERAGVSTAPPAVALVS
ncbi:hypothetical protein D9Q98_004528 [Chlorella vulgaris]|uniref:RING-type domain-containing protein n=1 Tax=Chlorella vulgaris TaxID=3077 RepID=A0A9D4YX56_CHLVU|nr:hypothetical protein D9Q98_004528 [Chlorella vulgaris]